MDKMRNCFLKASCLLTVVFHAISCGKNKKVDVTFSVFITKKVDSLPCSATVQYGWYSNVYDQQISGDWMLTEHVDRDTKGTLSVTSQSNIKALTIEVKTNKGLPVAESCNTDNCSASVTKEDLGH